MHDRIKALDNELAPTNLQLSITTDRIALLAGKVWHVPGVTEIRRREAFKRFKPQLARDKFPELVAELSMATVQSRLLMKALPRQNTASWTELRAEAELFDRRCRELNTSMLARAQDVAPEGPRTDELAELHDRFLQLMSKKARLDIDKQELRAQAIQMTESWDGIEGLWTHKRKTSQKFDGNAFRTNYREAAAQCAVTGDPFIHRHVFFSRSY